MRIGRAGALTVIVAMGSGTALAAVTPAVAGEAITVVINEIESSGSSDVLGGVDWVELKNTGGVELDISGMIFKDNKDADIYTIPDATIIPAGGYYVIENSETGAGFGFGLGGGDAARLFDTDGTTLIDSYTWTAHATATYGRCADGIGDFSDNTSATPGAANDCPTATAPEPPATPVTAAEAFRINETQSTGATADFIEIVNTASVAVSFDGVVVMDDKDQDAWVATGIGEVPAGGHLTLTADVHFVFGLGKGDSVRLFAPGTELTATGGLAGAAAPFDATTWPSGQHTAPTWGRCPDATGEFAMTTTATPGAVNDCGVTPPDGPGEGPGEGPVVEPAEYSSSLAINEVESNGDDTDWLEVANLTASPIDISGYAIKDNDNSRTDVVPAGSVVPAHGLLVIDQESATYPQGFTFGLGNGDAVRLYDLGGTLVAKHTWAAHALVSWARCPDGTGDWRDATTSTKGTPNDCSAPVRINETESSGTAGVLAGADWIELMNVSAQPLDLGGFTLKDDKDDHAYTFAPGTMIGAGALLVITEGEFGFGLGSTDTARLFDASGTLVDSFTQPAHAVVTWGRCPDGTGAFEDNAAATPGQANVCEGLVYASAWPGGSDVKALDDEGLFTGDLSGIDYEPATGSTPGTLWAVQNGDGLLYKIVSDGEGGWVPAAGWESGKKLLYPGGTGTVDAEGATVTSAGAAGGVYVSSERNNDASSTSRPAVLRFDVSGTGSTLVATAEWNLAADFPGLGANAGLEGVTWVPDGFLTARGFIDENTSAAYNPAAYAGHGSGLFFVGVEGTASVYAYALMADGSFKRIATIATTSVSFSLVADVQFDAQAGVLYVVCDEACGGRIAAYSLSASGTEAGKFTASALYERPAGMANIANEGFAVADASQCVAGKVATFYADDADTDGLSLRTGTMDCATTATVTGPAAAVPGDTVKIGVGSSYAGQSVQVWLHSTPVLLGTFTVSSSGSVSAVIPVGTVLGAHSLVVTRTDGTLIGSTGIVINAVFAAPGAGGAGALASTGANQSGALAIGAALLIAAGLVMLGRKRA